MMAVRRRRWPGMLAVGGTVLMAAAGLAFDLPHRLIDPLADQTFSSAIAAITLVWMLHVAMLAPLDASAGLEGARDWRAVLRWVSGWMRGVIVQWLWFTLAASLLLRFGQQFGITRALLVFLLLQVALLSRQGLLAWLIGGIRIAEPSAALREAAATVGISARDVREVDVDDPAFTGVWTGIDARTLWVPLRWVRDLTAAQLGVALARREGVRALGLRRRGVLVAIAWNTVGFALAASAPHADLMTAAGFVTLLAWFTLWSFGGVLLLPVIARPAVIAADRWARSSHDHAAVTSTIAQLASWHDDGDADVSIDAGVFESLPSRAARVRALEANDAPTDTVAVAAGAWRATTTMLYLSGACGGGLARALPRNIGRPALWVMQPDD